jgi:tetratricopeptide (TPR) repeat protein
VPSSPTEPAAGAGPSPEEQALELAARAQAHLDGGRLDQAVHAASQGAALRVRLDVTLPMLARALEAQGDGVAALEIWSQAVDAVPDDAANSAEMGRMAVKLGKHAVAENVLARHLSRWPAEPQVVAWLAQAQTGQRAYDRAHETLKAALEADAGQPLLWRTLAELLGVQGRQAQAVVFFEEALRLDMGSVEALDGIADALLLGAGDDARALEASEAALAQATGRDRPRIMANHARRLLSAGRLDEGWEAFSQLVWPGDAAAVTVKIAAPRLSPDQAVEGRLLLMGETDVVEEVLLAQTVPRLTADGVKPILAVQPGWEALARRSFPDAAVVTMKKKVEGERRLLAAELDSPHVHGGELVGAWAPLRALPALYCARPEQMGGRPYLTPDPLRVAHWRERLAALGPGAKAGVVWRPPGACPQPWEAPPIAALKGALEVPGVQLIGVQAQDMQGELGWIGDTYGLAIHEPPPELRLWDLDDLAAMTLALDVVVGLPDAAAIVGAACGAETWILSPPRHWMRLGTDHYPWFPKARVMAADGPGDWDRALGDLNAALGELAARPAQSSRP